MISSVLYIKFETLQMKKVVTLYKQFYGLTDEVSDGVILFQIIVFTLFFFVLGFTVSQVIIFLVR